MWFLWGCCAGALGSGGPVLIFLAQVVFGHEFNFALSYIVICTIFLDQSLGYDMNCSIEFRSSESSNASAANSSSRKGP